jgi:multimeric flavodoxin WrbA
MIVQIVVGFSGSPRPDGNTHFLVKEALAAAEAAGAEVRFYDLNETPVRGCQACMACKEPGHEGRCAVDDAFTAMNEDIRRADALVFGAPVYIGYWSGQAKNFIDRWYCYRSRNAYHFPPVKRAAMVCTCGADAESYQGLLDKQVSWMTDRLGLDTRGLMAANLSGKDAAAGRVELVSKAREIGAWLAQG